MLLLILLVVFDWNLHGEPAYAEVDASQAVSSTDQPREWQYQTALSVAHCQSAGSCSHSAAIASSLTFPHQDCGVRPFKLARSWLPLIVYSFFRPPRLPAKV